MNRDFLLGAALLGLAAFASPTNAQLPPTGSFARPPGDPVVAPGDKPPVPVVDMQEDIEIMRRLLDGAFAQAYGFNEFPKGSAPPIVITTFSDASQYQPNNTGWTTTAPIHPAPHTEGVYLKDYGVVYTVTLPPTGFDPLPKNNSRTDGKGQPDDWDRIRKEIHGESPDQPGKAVPAHKPLSEVILKVLADNGKHFSALADGEKISVAVTFRGAANCAICHGNPTATPPLKYNWGFPESGAIPLSAPGTTPQRGVETGTPTVAAERTSLLLTDVHNAVLLGDLHMKQGKTKEAIEAYQKALQQMGQSVTTSSSKEDQVAGLLTAVDVCNKLAAAYVQAGNSGNEAAAMLKRASELAKKAEALTGGQAGSTGPVLATPATAAQALPAKLVVTASKKLLDDVGAGRMTFEAFCKAATVEYVNPPSEKK